MNAHNKQHDGETMYSGEGPGRPDRIQGRAGAQAFAGQRSVVPDPEFTRSASLNGGGRGGRGRKISARAECSPTAMPDLADR